MKPEEQKILNESLVNLFKLDQEQLATLYNEAGDLQDLSVVIEADKKRISKFNSDKTNQLNRGIKEGAEKLEKAVRDKYSIESDLLGVELIDHVVLSKVEEATKAGTKDISKHPEFVKAQLEFDKKLKERDKEWEAKIAKKDEEFNRAKIFDKVKSKALSLLETNKAILPVDPTKAENWKATYLKELEGGIYQLTDEGEITVMDKDGILKNAHGHTVSFDEFAKNISDKYFDYQKAENRSSPANKEVKNDNPNFKAPRNKEELYSRLKDPKITPKERVELTEYGQKNNLL